MSRFRGLDPVNTKVMENEIHRMKAEGTTIIFSTHRMEQVEELCDYIALINKGTGLYWKTRSIRCVKQFQKELYHLDFAGPDTAFAEACLGYLLNLPKKGRQTSFWKMVSPRRNSIISWLTYPLRSAVSISICPG